jgi:Xaa-Pro aminopeptidase
MLTAEGCANRRKRLWEAVPETVDMMILADPASLIYFANYAPSPFVFRSCDASAVLVLQRESATLVADKMVKVFLDQAHVDEIVAPVWYDGKHAAPHRKALLVKTAVDLLVTIPGSGLAVESASLPAGIIMGMEAARGPITASPLEDVIRSLRRVKDPDEVALIRAAIHAGEAGHAAALAGVRPGMTEVDMFALVQRAATEAAGQPVIVYGDFVSGPRVELEHGGMPGLRKIEKGDLVLIDYSVVVHGYRGDFTNTFVVEGSPTQAQRDLFKACLECMDAAEAGRRRERC